MQVDARDRRCPKCDNRIDLQTDGSTITVDIAHQGERVNDALRKLAKELKTARQGVALYLRVVVGSGVIRDEVMSALLDYEARKIISDFYLDSRNSGAIMVRLKP